MPKIACVLKEYTDVFSLDNNKLVIYAVFFLALNIMILNNLISLILNPTFKTSEEKTEAVEKVLIDLRARQIFKKLNGWRSEHYNVKSRFSKEFLFEIERSGSSIFGIRCYGVHINVLIYCLVI